MWVCVDMCECVWMCVDVCVGADMDMGVCVCARACESVYVCVYVCVPSVRVVADRTGAQRAVEASPTYVTLTAVDSVGIPVGGAVAGSSRHARAVADVSVRAVVPVSGCEWGQQHSKRGIMRRQS